MVHNRQTVWYIRRRYVRGDATYDYHYKRELLTTDTYRNLDSVYWSSDKPITKRTFERAQRDGYKCDTYCVYLPPVELIDLEARRELHGRNRTDTRERGAAERHGQVIRLLQLRLSKSMGV